MSFIEPEVLPETTEPEPVVRPRTTTRERTRTKRQPPYAVVLHNDDLNGFDYVVGVLRKVFNYGRLNAFGLTLAAHVGGRSTIWRRVGRLSRGPAIPARPHAAANLADEEVSDILSARRGGPVRRAWALGDSGGQPWPTANRSS